MSAVETPKILEALTQLDSANNDHWTEDGLPKTSVVQAIAKDTTIKRSDIQDARPGFDRDMAKAEAPTNFEDPAAAPAPAPSVGAAAPLVVQGDNMQAARPDETVQISDEQLLALLDMRVKKAEDLIQTGRDRVAQGAKDQDTGREQLAAARRDKFKYFPPITEAQNIQSYLAASNAERAARVASHRPPSHLDAVRGRLGGSVNRGYGNGAMRGAYSRREAARLGFRVPGSPAAQGVKA